jgi:pyruvate dehydrogenase (quinone)
MRTPGDVASGWDRAFAATRPVVINAYVDPEVPPLPPHITFEQARNYMVALFKGEPHAARAFKQSVKGMAAKYKHHLPGQSGEEGTREGTREPDGG